MRVAAAFAAIHALEGHHQTLRDLFLLHKRHGIANVNVPARMTWHHRHGKGRLLLPKHLGQRGENRHVPFTSGGIGVRGKTPDFRPDHVKRHRAYAHLAPHPTVLLPGAQPLQRHVGAKTLLAGFGVRQRRRQRVETPTAVERHLPGFGVGSCPSSLRLIPTVCKPGTMPSFLHLYERVVPWSPISLFTSWC